MTTHEDARVYETDNSSLSKWKLVVVGVLLLAGLGWCDPHSALLMLSFTGLLCAYVDAMCYRRSIAAHMNAAFAKSGNQAESRNDWSHFVNGVHASNRSYAVESTLIPWSSAIPAIALPVAAAGRLLHHTPQWQSLLQSPVLGLSTVLGLAGLWAICGLWKRFREERWYFLSMGPERVQQVMEIGKNRMEPTP